MVAKRKTLTTLAKATEGTTTKDVPVVKAKVLKKPAAAVVEAEDAEPIVECVDAKTKGKAKLGRFSKNMQESAKLMKKPAAAKARMDVDENEKNEVDSKETPAVAKKKPKLAGKPKKKIEEADAEKVAEKKPKRAGKPKKNNQEDEAEKVAEKKPKRGGRAKKTIEEDDEEDDAEEEKAKTVSAKKQKSRARPKKKVEEEDEEEEDAEEDEEDEEEEEEDDEEDEEEEEEEAAETVSAKKQKSRARPKKKVEEEVDEEEEDDEEEDEEEEDEVDEAEEEEAQEESEEVKIARQEQDIVDRRSKELKAMPVGELKELVKNELEIEKMKKEDMIKALLKHEAKARADLRERQAKIRSIVMSKKEELENLSVSDLAKTCANMGIEGVRAKQDRIREVLKKWQSEDGVPKALAAEARDARCKELMEMDVGVLRKLCERNDIDPFVTEVMAERISKVENAVGRYARPQLAVKEKTSDQQEKGDLVDKIIANEKSRVVSKKKEIERAAALNAKRKELKAMSPDELKKLLTRKGLDTTGKKEELLERLFAASLQEEALEVRKSELQGLAIQELKSTVASFGIDVGKKKDDMVKAIIEHEAKQRKELEAFDGQVVEIMAQKKQEFDDMSNPELKDMCSEKGLAVGGSKEEKVARLLEHGKPDFIAEVSQKVRNQRKQELLNMDKAALSSICEKVGIDPFVKVVMTERILTFEEEGGVMEPVSKRARKAK